MTAAAAGTLLILFLPFLLSLAGQSGMAKMLCLMTSVLGLLLSVEENGAVLPWALGMLIAGVSVWERIRQRRMA
jgi:hypothetical protein